jgi:uncharacterized protein (DUF2147 family)
VIDDRHASRSLRLRRSALLILLALATAGATDARAAEADDILGAWDTQGGISRVKIARCGDDYCGEITWIKPLPPGSPGEGTSSERRDTHNPDPALTGRPLIGLRILTNFKYRNDEATWAGGSIYDPEHGKSYSARMRLLDRDRLELRGYIGIPLFGRTVVWTRSHADLRQAEGTADSAVPK